MIVILHFLIVFGYYFLIKWIVKIWVSTSDDVISPNYNSAFKYSIVIPFKNEEQSIKRCIECLLNLAPNSPDYEIICIDDHSSDKSAKIVSELDIQIYKANEIGKKAALRQGIELAGNSWIITLDADVMVEPKWLISIDQHIQNNHSDVVVGPVKIVDTGHLINRFQIMDFAATMGITLAGIKSKLFFLCNGANFIFKKDLFFAVNGYQGNEDIASGDDVFLLDKFSKQKHCNITYLKSRTGSVITTSEDTVGALRDQRKRWATKTKAYANRYVICIQGFVFIYCLLLMIELFLLSWMISFWFMLTGIFLLSAKLIIDYRLLHSIVSFFGEKSAMKSYLPAALWYVIYIIVVGFYALIPTQVDWKGRKV